MVRLEEAQGLTQLSSPFRPNLFGFQLLLQSQDGHLQHTAGQNNLMQATSTNSPLFYYDLLLCRKALFVIGIKNALLQSVINRPLIKVKKNCKS